MAAPTGTPIHAPAPGIISLAEPNMHFDGGITLIDHGQGLISVYLHQSKQFVRKGDFVKRGQIIGHVGMTGRATGPHLCWRLHWRTRNLDPSLLVGARSPI
jgi:murein DD-endopeptidase MepM/ murein hydrolase activator NlpD